MNVISIVKELQDSLSKVGYIDSFDFIIKDELEDTPKIRENIQGYLAWISLANVSIDFSAGDKIELLFGISGVSSQDNDDYLQVVSQCLWGIKKALIDTTYVKENDINDIQITIDSEKKEDSTIVYCYTSLITDIKLAYGSNV